MASLDSLVPIELLRYYGIDSYVIGYFDHNLSDSRILLKPGLGCEGLASAIISYEQTK